MRLDPVQTMLCRHPVLDRRVVACEQASLVCEHPRRSYADNLRRQNIERVNTDEPIPEASVPFDLCLARLNAQLRTAKRDVRDTGALDQYV